MATDSRNDLFDAPLTDHGPAAGLQIVSYEVRLPEGMATGPHRHSYTTAGRVIEGVFRFQVDGGEAKDLKAGDVFSEPAGVTVKGWALTSTTLHVVLVREPGVPEAKPAEEA